MPDFPALAFLPVESLLIHERHDDQRTRPLVLRIRLSGVWRNPPIVAPLRDGTLRYMVLDGANRVTSLVEMGFPHALVQVVEPDDPGLTLQNWNHVVWEMNAARFLDNIRLIDGLNLTPVQSAADAISPQLEGDCGLALVQTGMGGLYAACTETDELKKRVDLLNALVDSYKDHARLDRTNVQDVRPLANVYPSLCGLVVFPHFSIWDLLKLAGQSYLLPAGITRFMISPRALHLNYPLEELADNRPIEVKNRALQKWVQERLAHKQVRYYAEPTYLFDE